MKKENRIKESLYNILLPVIGVLTILIFWELSSRFLIDPKIFPGPVMVIKAAVVDISGERLLQHIWISMLRVLIGFSVGAILGVILGLISAWYITLGNILQAPIEVVRPIPPIAWIPLAIFWMGLGEYSKIFIISLGSFFPLFTNTYKGACNVDARIIQAGRTFDLKGLRLLFKISLPLTLPDIATGIRVGWSYSFGLMVAAELIAAKSGLGYLIMHARELGQVSLIMLGIIIIGILSLLTDFIIQDLIIKKKLRWHFINVK